ncbi:hypothetical protein SAMN04488490_3114 [Marinobacter sp. LV10R510-11A]|uniref:hypothetical protein n=1 Tax=Marinobacter sp. LV10R510-11A TaxID=1415568 RepID=UPI000BB81379|nr:hypothetical protein [Marinobacter sp. LV10R510-11A]SOB77314.1 hypothetical protein SAMN04488490_3114 [Marinobacter sp. LV10R510-11A]
MITTPGKCRLGLKNEGSDCFYNVVFQPEITHNQNNNNQYNKKEAGRTEKAHFAAGVGYFFPALVIVGTQFFDHQAKVFCP